jgi:ankyrin repeat protein
MLRHVYLILLGLLLAACGMDEQAAREAAKSKQLPPTEQQLMAKIKEGGHDKEGKLLVEAGVNPNAAQSNGVTVLMAAAFNGQHNTAKALLEKGADVKGHSGGYDALGFAVEKGDVPMVKLLVDHGADPQWVPPAGKSAVQRAKERPDGAALLDAMGVK